MDGLQWTLKLQVIETTGSLGLAKNRDVCSCIQIHNVAHPALVRIADEQPMVAVENPVTKSDMHTPS
jgi:hypothetical protein